MVMTVNDSCTEFFCLLFSLRTAERLLPGSRFHRYMRDGHYLVRSSAPYSVPDDVHHHLDFGELHFKSC